jgi:hypothetical protein
VACVLLKGCRVGSDVGEVRGAKARGRESGGCGARGRVGGDCVREVSFPTKY